jgi:hypothetical protein
MKWSGFYDFVLPELNGVPTDLVDIYLRRAAIEFCEETSVYVADHDPISIIKGIAEYDLEPPEAETDIVSVKKAWVNNAPIDYISQDTLNQRMSYWPADEAARPVAFTQQTQTSLLLYPKPTESNKNGLNMKVVLRPSLAASGLTDWMATKYIQEITDGAKSMLMGMENKPWSSQTGEAKYRAQFEAGKTRATIEALRSFTRASQQVQLKRIV